MTTKTIVSFRLAGIPEPIELTFYGLEESLAPQVLRPLVDALRSQPTSIDDVRVTIKEDRVREISFL